MSLSDRTQSDKESAQLFSDLIYCKNQFAEFSNIFRRWTLFYFPEQKLNLLHCFNVFLQGSRYVQLLKPFHLVHLNNCAEQVNRLWKQYLLNNCALLDLVIDLRILASL